MTPWGAVGFQAARVLDLVQGELADFHISSSLLGGHEVGLFLCHLICPFSDVFTCAGGDFPLSSGLVGSGSARSVIMAWVGVAGIGAIWPVIWLGAGGCGRARPGSGGAVIWLGWGRDGLARPVVWYGKAWSGLDRIVIWRGLVWMGLGCHLARRYGTWSVIWLGVAGIGAIWRVIWSGRERRGVGWTGVSVTSA